MDRETREALARLIQYNEYDELADWEANGRPEHHIIHDIRRLKGWVCCETPGVCPNACKCGCKEGLYLCRCYPELPEFEEES